MLFIEKLDPEAKTVLACANVNHQANITWPGDRETPPVPLGQEPANT